jgi:erythromycin esterase-like protein
VKKIYLLLIATVNTITISAQINKEALFKNTIGVSNIDWKTEPGIDIGIFDNALEEGKIIVLCEKDHGEGSSYEAQCKIIKSLIDSGKINAVFTESSWINIDRIVEILRIEGRNGIEETKKYMNSIELRYWVDNGFWNYLSEKIIDGKVSLAGFDIDGTASIIVNFLFEEALTFPEVKLFFKNNPENFELLKPEYEYYGGWNLNSFYLKEHYLRQEKFISIIINSLKTRNELKKIKEWYTILNHFFWMSQRSLGLKNNKYSNVIQSEKQNSSFHSIRDSLMADVFFERYKISKDKKIIALMTSYHALKQPDKIENIYGCCMDFEVNTIGKILNEKYSLKLHSLCFLSGKGEYGIGYEGFKNKYVSVKNPIAGSIEKVLDSSEYEYCLIDLENIVLKSFYMNAVFGRYLLSEWGRNYQTLFFIKSMKPLIFKNVFKHK